MALALPQGMIGRRGPALFFLLFALSGFSGLIYESIWTHYLKLFLGHAAYAQTLVLSIFMGGMALGSWLCSLRSARWPNLLRGYALAEGAIGAMSLLFALAFDAIVNAAHLSVIPALGSVAAANLFKWSLAALLILPQSVLLGMTFPLMSAGIIRRFPAEPGGAIAMLYFTNSLGGAIGVLVSGFVLIKAVGLPGTIGLAALINITLALIVWRLAGAGEAAPVAQPLRPEQGGAAVPYRLLLWVALLTGLASFIYEIGWIRMLSLVLGTSTHALELMLSAFIFGLAFGGLWIRRRIDRIGEPLRFLGWVQVAMGLFALSTLLLYGNSFNVMGYLLQNIAPTDAGYALFNLSSHALAVAIMLPATFCAGMTLPLITYALLRGGRGEGAIGKVYGANTVGAIAGVVFAVHLGMPLLGLKGLIAFGAALDCALGVLLLWHGRAPQRRPVAVSAGAAALAALVGVALGVDLDAHKMASGVYRYGTLLADDAVEVVLHADGKTASVDLTREGAGLLAIRTNGKTDAAINMAPGGEYHPDESTMIFAGALPLLALPNAQTAANIGMGSGLSTHVLLGGQALQQVDTIEIERAMVEAARAFSPRNDRTYHDPRSRIFIEDAKTFFSSRNMRYDIIISEPSNPWVSGVAGLFSAEFYGLVKRYLSAQGLLVQWMQLYEIDVELVMSVLKALKDNFADFVVYTPNHSDLIILASPSQAVPPLSSVALANEALVAELRRIGIHNLQDVMLRQVGDRRMLEPLIDSYAIAPNSDYYPVLDQGAVRARFLKHNAIDIINMAFEPIPTRELLGGQRLSGTRTEVTPTRHYLLSQAADEAAALRDMLLGGALHAAAPLRQRADAVRRLFFECSGSVGSAERIAGLFGFAVGVVPYLRPAELRAIWAALAQGPCLTRWGAAERDWLAFFEALGERDAPAIASRAEQLLGASPRPSQAQLRYLLAAAMQGYLAQGLRPEALALWEAHAPSAFPDAEPKLLFRLLVQHSRRAAAP